jgi:hypothetical protein
VRVPVAAPDTPASTAPARVSFPRGAWVVLGLFGVAMISLLGVQLALIEDQRSTTDRQLRTAVRQANASLPLIQDAQPLVEQLRGDAPAIRRFGRDAARLTKQLDKADAGEQLAAAGALARTLLDADVGSTTLAVRRLAANLLGADLPSTTRALNGFLKRARDERLVETAARAARAVPHDIVPTLDQSLRVQQQTLAFMRESLAIQRATLQAARDTLAVAKQTEQHAESIDRKTGGAAPAIPPVR